MRITLDIHDDCLLALAVRRGGCFVTFDARTQIAAVPGAGRGHLVQI